MGISQDKWSICSLLFFYIMQLFNFLLTLLIKLLSKLSLFGEKSNEILK